MRILTALSIISACLAGVPANAESYTNSQLLGFSESQRDWFYTGAFMSIGHMASIKDQAKGECVWSWYFNNRDLRVPQIETAMNKYPDHSPTAILIGMVQKECGAL